MGRPRTPTKVLEAKGAFRKDPQRRRDGEPEVKGPLGAPSERLEGDEITAWQEVCRYAPTGVLTEADRHHLEELCVLMAESWRLKGEFPVGQRALLTKMLGQLGMNPSERARLSIEKPKEANPFAELDP